MQRRTILLTSKDEAYISRQIDEGEYDNASEVVRAGLCLLQREQIKREALRHAIAQADNDLKAGRTTAYASGEIAGRLKSRVGKTHKESR